MLTSENIELALEAFNDVRCSGSEPVRYETPRTLESFVCDRAPEHLTAASQIHPVLAYPVMLGLPTSRGIGDLSRIEEIPVFLEVSIALDLHGDMTQLEQKTGRV